MTRHLLTFAVAVAALACQELDGGGHGNTTGPNPPTATGSSLPTFGSEAEFEAYMSQIAPSNGGGGGGGGEYAADAGAAAPSAAEGGEGEGEGEAEGAAPGNEEVTNNQEAGVDEGGIVKNIGDHLVVLRKGRLYAVDLDEPGAARQTDAVRVAPSEALNDGVWYDELLVRGRDIFVIGYRYVAYAEDAEGRHLGWIWGATEVDAFQLDDEGRLERRGVTFLESNDYYDTSNYASRMVDGRLLLYMPFGAFVWGDVGPRPHLPQRLEHVEGGHFRAVGPLFVGTDVAVAGAEYESTFHTLLACEVGVRASLDCHAKSVLGDWARQFYVSASHVFIWATDKVFAFSLADLSVRAHAVRGYPTDQMSFTQTEGALPVTVTREIERARREPVGGPDAGVWDGDDWQPPELVVERLVLPLADFDAVGTQEIAAAELDRGEDLWVSRVRYVDGWVLAAVEDWARGGHLVAQRLADGATFELPMSGYLSRIEPMAGIGALTVAQTEAGLELCAIDLGDGARLLDPVTLEGVGSGESRSHGFFFRPTGSGGLFGLAVLGEQAPQGDAWWGDGVSNIAFFDANRAGGLELLGTVSAGGDAEGVCETSCVDWYGNTRPIFLRDRAFALMGSELVELEIGEGVEELARLALR